MEMAELLIRALLFKLLKKKKKQYSPKVRMNFKKKKKQISKTLAVNFQQGK